MKGSSRSSELGRSYNKRNMKSAIWIKEHSESEDGFDLAVERIRRFARRRIRGATEHTAVFEEKEWLWFVFHMSARNRVTTYLSALASAPRVRVILPAHFWLEEVRLCADWLGEDGVEMKHINRAQATAWIAQDELLNDSRYVRSEVLRDRLADAIYTLSLQVHLGGLPEMLLPEHCKGIAKRLGMQEEMGSMIVGAFERYKARCQRAHLYDDGMLGVLYERLLKVPEYERLFSSRYKGVVCTYAQEMPQLFLPQIMQMALWTRAGIVTFTGAVTRDNLGAHASNVKMLQAWGASVNSKGGQRFKRRAINVTETRTRTWLSMLQQAADQVGEIYARDGTGGETAVIVPYLSEPVYKVFARRLGRFRIKAQAYHPSTPLSEYPVCHAAMVLAHVICGHGQHLAVEDVQCALMQVFPFLDGIQAGYVRRAIFISEMNEEGRRWSIQLPNTLEAYMDAQDYRDVKAFAEFLMDLHAQYMRAPMPVFDVLRRLWQFLVQNERAAQAAWAGQSPEETSTQNVMEIERRSQYLRLLDAAVALHDLYQIMAQANYDEGAMDAADASTLTAHGNASNENASGDNGLDEEQLRIINRNVLEGLMRQGIPSLHWRDIWRDNGVLVASPQAWLSMRPHKVKNLVICGVTDRDWYVRRPQQVAGEVSSSTEGTAMHVDDRLIQEASRDDVDADKTETGKEERLREVNAFRTDGPRQELSFTDEGARSLAQSLVGNVSHNIYLLSSECGRQGHNNVEEESLAPYLYEAIEKEKGGAKRVRTVHLREGAAETGAPFSLNPPANTVWAVVWERLRAHILQGQALSQRELQKADKLLNIVNSYARGERPEIIAKQLKTRSDYVQRVVEAYHRYGFDLLKHILRVYRNRSGGVRAKKGDKAPNEGQPGMVVKDVSQRASATSAINDKGFEITL